MSENEKKPDAKPASKPEAKAKGPAPEGAKTKKPKGAKSSGGGKEGGKKEEVILSPESLTLDGLEDASKIKIPKIKGAKQIQNGVAHILGRRRRRSADYLESIIRTTCLRRTLSIALRTHSQAHLKSPQL